MPIRITGLNSGLDTESIISALVSSYNYKTQKYQKAQTKLSWKQDAWKTLNTKIYSLYKNLGNLKLSSAYNMKSATVSNSTKVSVTAGSGAVNGSYSVHVTSMAKAGYLTGAKLDSGTTASTTLSQLGYTDSGEISLKVGDGDTKTMEVDGTTTIQSVVNWMNSNGVKASFDASNRRMYVSAKDTGEANDFSLTSNTKGAGALEGLGLNVITKAEITQYEALAAYKSNDDSYLSGLITAKRNALQSNETLKESNTLLEADNNTRETQNANYQMAIDYYDATKFIETLKTNYNVIDGDYALLEKLAKETELTDNKFVGTDGKIYTKSEDGNSYTDEDGNVYTKNENDEYINKEGTELTTLTPASEKLENLKTAFKISDEENWTTFKESLSKITEVDTKKAADTDLQTIVDGITDDIKKSEYKAVISANEQKIIENTNQIASNNSTIAENNATIADHTLINSEVTITANMTNDQITEAAIKLQAKVDYAAELKADGKLEAASVGLGATRIEGSDATIYVNDAQYTGTSNTFAVNGMTITAIGVTSKENEMTDENAVNVTVGTDTQGLYDKVKDFLSQYNSLINEMTALYNADSAKGYEPLTDEEKDAMSDTEVEKWEEKIKASLLRRDSTLSGLISTMTNTMSKGIEIGTGDNKKTYYLSSFGIKTLGYLNAPKNEHSAYHIDGDEDDVNTSGNADKLMAELAKDPDVVIEFMQKLSDNLYEAVHEKMKSTTLSSIYTVYNDKEMASEYSDYTSLITKWQERLEKQEEYYYNKFAAMESSLAKINSQTSSLSGLFGS